MSSPGEQEGRHEEHCEARGSTEYATERHQVLIGGVKEYGEAFLAYLTLPNVDVADPQIVDHFIDLYAGHYESRKALVESQIDSLGWIEALAMFREREGIWEDDLTWDYDELWRHCLEVYSVNERFGGVHVFMR